MPTPAFIAIEGETQGPITSGAFTADSVGNVFVEGHEDEIMVQQYDHIVTIPRDPQSGQPAGQRVHKPFMFTAALDKATPLMYNALCSGEKLTTCELRWYRTAVSGKQEHFFTIKLEDALVVDINAAMPHCQDPATQDFTQLVTYSLSYRKIEWTHEIAGTSGSDDWRAPLV